MSTSRNLYKIPFCIYALENLQSNVILYAISQNLTVMDSWNVSQLSQDEEQEQLLNNSCATFLLISSLRTKLNTTFEKDVQHNEDWLVPFKKVLNQIRS